MHNGNMRHARAIKFDYTNLLVVIILMTEVSDSLSALLRIKMVRQRLFE